MSLIGADGGAEGFDIYGAPQNAGNTGTLLAAAGFSQISCTLENNINGVVPPSGSGMAYFGSYSNQLARPVSQPGIIPQSQQIKLNYSGGVYGGDVWGIAFLDINSAIICKAVFRNNGAIALCNGGQNLNANKVAETAAGLCRLGTWQTWEFVYKPNTGNGTVGAPYNGILQLWLEGVLYAQATGLSQSVQPAFHYVGPNGIVGGGLGVCAKDWISNDANGTDCAAIPLGPRRTQSRLVNGNGATDNWVIGGGAASLWQAVSKAPPNLTTYIEGDNPGDVQEFTLPATILSVAGVSAVIVKAYAQKTNSGAGTFKLSVLSGGSVVNSAEITPGIGGAYFNGGAMYFDPATGAHWLSPAYNTIGLRITRVQ